LLYYRLFHGFFGERIPLSEMGRTEHVEGS
jgi:hypothetical protein